MIRQVLRRHRRDRRSFMLTEHLFAVFALETTATRALDCWKDVGQRSTGTSVSSSGLVQRGGRRRMWRWMYPTDKNRHQNSAAAALSQSGSAESSKMKLSPVLCSAQITNLRTTTMTCDAL